MRFIFALVLLTLAVVYATEFPIVPNSYIVVFQRNTPEALAAAHIKNITGLSAWSQDHKIKSTFNIEWFSGYTAQVYSDAVLRQISSSAIVQYVEQDSVVRKMQTCPSQSPATWGIARTSTINIVPGGPYIRPEQGGEGVRAYIIDTGILTTHVDFGGRASVGANFIPSESNQDLNGHGTHCAGTVGGNTYGIAKKCTLIAVKVLDRNGSGTVAGVVDGINWTANHGRGTLATANLSLGGGFSQASNNAVDAMVTAGVFTAVAAGNSDANACNYSPASSPLGTCVGATDSSDIRAYFSNWGQCVDIMAPGVSITSDYIGASNAATAVLSGTSMAAPHVCGVGAVYRGKNPLDTAADVKNWVINTRSAKIPIGDLKGSPSRLLHQGCY
jgi:subtilisin family serine protease